MLFVLRRRGREFRKRRYGGRDICSACLARSSVEDKQDIMIVVRFEIDLRWSTILASGQYPTRGLLKLRKIEVKPSKLRNIHECVACRVRGVASKRKLKLEVPSLRQPRLYTFRFASTSFV